MSIYRHTFILLRKNLLSSHPIQITETRHMKRYVSPTLKELYKRRERVKAEPEKPRSTFLEWNYEAELFAFGKRLGEDFDRKALKQALTQRSFTSDDNNDIGDNSTLINEGNSFITSQIDEFYDNKYPKIIKEAIKNYLMSEEMLAHVGRHLGLVDLIKTSEFPVETTTISNTFKAIVAVLKAANLNRAKDFVKDFLFCQLIDKEVIDDIWRPEKPIEYLSGLLKSDEIEARLCNQSAINTILANYQVGLYKNKKMLGVGWGESIDIAKNTAAINAIQRIYANYKNTK